MNNQRLLQVGILRTRAVFSVRLYSVIQVSRSEERPRADDLHLSILKHAGLYGKVSILRTA